MSVRTPYMASGLGHAVALGLLLTVSALQKPAPLVPNVRIVALPGGGRPGPKSVAPAPKVRPEPAAAPKVEAPPVVEPPKPKAKTPEQTPPPKPVAKPADPKGTLAPVKREIVSKGPAPAKQPVAAPVAPAPAPAAAAAGDGAKNPSATRSIGVETDGEPGPLSGYLSLLRDKVAAQWAPPPAVSRKGEVRAVIAFVVGRDGGAPRDVAVAVSSGDRNFDLGAMRAVYGANPLPPLPGNSAADAIGIRFTFFQEY